MKRRLRRSHRSDPAEINITAFMNLMVILVPFLLITAVFSRLAVLELNLPGPSAATTEQDEARLNLEIVVRADVLDVRDRRSGRLKRFATGDNGHDFDQLTAFLKEIKARHPDVTEATLLLEPEVDYDTLVEVMDAVRVVAVEESEAVVLAELFPEISIGDAPLTGGGK